MTKKELESALRAEQEKVAKLNREIAVRRKLAQDLDEEHDRLRKQRDRLVAMLREWIPGGSFKRGEGCQCCSCRSAALIAEHEKRESEGQ